MHRIHLLIAMALLGGLVPQARSQSALRPISELRAEATPEGLRLHRREGLTLRSCGPEFLAAGGPGEVWSYPSDGSWIGDTVALAAGGTEVLSSWGAYERRVSLFSRHDPGAVPEVVWDDVELEYNWRRRTAGADTVGRFAELHQRYAVQGQSQREADLALYDSSSAAPVFTYTLPTVLPALAEAEVEMTADGTRTLAYVFEGMTSSALLTRVVAQGGGFAVDSEGRIPLAGIPVAFCVSADGSTAAFGTTHRITVVNTDTMTAVQELTHFGEPQYGALGLSADGSRLVFGTRGRARILERGSDGLYAEVLEHPLEPNQYCLRAALSPDGASVTLGIQDLGAMGDARVRAVEVATGTTLVEVAHESTAPHQNYVWRIDHSDDGRIVAVGLWGDEGLDDAPELLVLDLVEGTVILERDFPGSVLELDLSGDGRTLAVASKGVHANTFGGGGALTLLQLRPRSVMIEGVPRAGSTIQVGVVAREGWQVALLGGPDRLAVPVPAPELFGLVLAGWLHLDLSTATVQGPATVGEGNVHWWPLTLPSGPGAAGRVLHFQGADLTRAELSADVTRITVLPAAP